jgi:hypothetical protein
MGGEAPYVNWGHHDMVAEVERLRAQLADTRLHLRGTEATMQRHLDELRSLADCNARHMIRADRAEAELARVRGERDRLFAVVVDEFEPSGLSMEYLRGDDHRMTTVADVAEILAEHDRRSAAEGER